MVRTRAHRRTRNEEGSERGDEDGIGLDFRTKNLFDQVFGIDLLRETIIDYVLHANGGKCSKKRALLCRMVQKSWLETVFKCLVKSGMPVVKLGRYRSKFETFAKIWKPSSRLTFKLEVSLSSVTCEQQLELLGRWLNLYGNGLVELDLTVSLDNEFLQENKKYLEDFTQQSFALPVLRTFVYSAPRIEEESNTDWVNGGIHMSSLPQSILSGCLRLKYLTFKAGCFNPKPLPTSFGNLLLPPTITNLVLDCPRGNNYLEPLIKNNMLRKLTDLSVVLPVVPCEEKEWICALLDRVRNTLKTLTILYGFSDGAEIPKIDPPVMKCLERILIHGKNFEWADGVSNLQEKLPALQNLVIRHATSIILKKWTENSTFGSLTDVSIEFDEYAGSTEAGSLTLEDAQLMSEAFPKVTRLKISTLCVGNVNQALQCLFENMTQLQVLTITLFEVRGQVVHPRFFDALLLGISCELIETLVEECESWELWEAVQLRVDKQCSLSNLPELREFSLEFKPVDEPTFVSEKVREFVVSAMPNLQKIYLRRPTMYYSQYSKAVIRKWEETGRVFNWE